MISEKNDDNIKKEYDEIDWIDISDHNNSYERDQINKNYEVGVTNDIEDFKKVKLE